MERLTYVAENGEVLFHPADLPDDEGITITQLAKDGRYKALEEIAERLANREQVEEQGLLLRLPCKVGDTVWQIMISGMNRKEKKLLYGIYEATVTEVSVDFYRNLLISTITNDTKKCKNKVTISEIGETIFLDREEAEAKLKEMEGESDVL